MASSTMTIYAYGNVEALHGIFNAVAMLMGGSEWDGLVRLAVLIGFTTVAVLSLAPGNSQKGINWLLSVAVLSGVLFTPKVTVVIEDKLGLDAPRVVANVPLMMGLVGSIKSSIGAYLTEAFETAFQTIPDGRPLPAQLSYLEHGVMFGSRTMRAAREASMNGVINNGDTVNFIRNCIFPDLGRQALPGGFESSTNLASFFADTNPALFSSYHDAKASWATVVAPCPTVYNYLNTTRWMGDAGGALDQVARRLFPSLAIEQSRPKAEASLQAMAIKAKLATASASAQNIMLQNMLINATADASALSAASIDDPGLLTLASIKTQANASTTAGYLVSGRIAEEALPVVRNVVEAILYAVFPVICVLAIASEGRALLSMLKSYLYVLLWVELWPPMFAVVNFLQTNRAADNLYGASQFRGGFSLDTASVIYQTGVSDLAVASWMVTFVPLIAAAVLFGMDRIMSITGTTPGKSEAEKTASEASRGNLTLGNMSLGQRQLAEYTSDPFMRTTKSVGGEVDSSAATGQERYRHAMSTGPVSMSDVSTLASQRGTAASRSKELATAESQSAETSIQAGLTKAEDLIRSGRVEQRVAQAWRQSQASNEAESWNDTRTTAQQLVDKWGTGDAITVAKALRAGVSAPLIAEAMGIRAGVEGSTSDATTAQRQIAEQQAALKQRSHARNIQSLESFANDVESTSGTSAGRQAAQGIRADLTQSRGFKESADRRLSEANRYAEEERMFQALSRSWTVNNANALYDHFAREGLDPHNANISSEQWHASTLRFLRSGQVSSDEQGLPTFMADNGQGPNFMLPAALTPEAMEGRYRHGAAPLGGRDAVMSEHQAQLVQVQTAQRKAGVSPRQAVGGTATRQHVEEGIGRLEDTISLERGTQQSEVAMLQNKSDTVFRKAPGAPGSLSRAVTEDNTARDAESSRPRPGRAEQEIEAASIPSGPRPQIPSEPPKQN